MNILVSACLMGVKCRYDGGGELAPGIRELMERCHLVPVCPEIMGGLATPRTPAERQDGRVVTQDGQDVTGGGREAGKALRLQVRAVKGAQPLLRKRQDIRRNFYEKFDSRGRCGSCPPQGGGADRIRRVLHRAVAERLRKAGIDERGSEEAAGFRSGT